MIQEQCRQILITQHANAQKWLSENFDSFVRNYQEIAESGRRVFENYTCTKKNPKNPDWPLVCTVVIILNLNPKTGGDFFTYKHSTTIARDLLRLF